MCSASFSELKKSIYSYLGFRGVGESAQTDALIASCLAELDEVQQFNCLAKIYRTPPAFLQKQPYRSFLEGCTAVILSVTTLGAETDRRIKRLARTDVAKSIVFDACASALLEYLADRRESRLGENLTYRFCPGYGGSDVRDIAYIFELLHPEKIGVTLLDTGYMLPSKSMAGVIGAGKRSRKSCGNCFMLPHCQYRKEGARCYVSEDN